MSEPFIASDNDCSMWSFRLAHLGTRFAVGTTEEDAIAELAKKRSAQHYSYHRGIIYGKDGWIMTFSDGTSEWWSRGEKLSAEAPAPRPPGNPPRGRATLPGAWCMTAVM